MAHMRVFASHFAAYIVETNVGTEIVPYDLAGPLAEGDTEALEEYLEGNRIESVTLNEGAWYARLSAPGYLDCTEWDGPHDTQVQAVKSVCDLHQCDENGEDNEATA